LDICLFSKAAVNDPFHKIAIATLLLKIGDNIIKAHKAFQQQFIPDKSASNK
jgi:hypothetical protein